MIVENIIPRNIIINLGCASVDNQIPRDDIFDYHPCRECNIYILYADDTVILAESQEQLQAALNSICLYCQTWKLEVNPAKNKTSYICKKES